MQRWLPVMVRHLPPAVQSGIKKTNKPDKSQPDCTDWIHKPTGGLAPPLGSQRSFSWSAHFRRLARNNEHLPETPIGLLL